MIKHKHTLNTPPRSPLSEARLRPPHVRPPSARCEWSDSCVLRGDGLVRSSGRLPRTWPQSPAWLPPQLQSRAPRPGASAARGPVRSVAPCRAASVARCLTHCLEGGTTPATLGGTSSSLVMGPTLGRQASQVGRVSEPQRQPPGRLGCGLATVRSARSDSCSWRCRDGRAWSSSASMVPGLSWAAVPMEESPASCDLRTEPSATRIPRPTCPVLT